MSGYGNRKLRQFSQGGGLEFVLRGRAAATECPAGVTRREEFRFIAAARKSFFVVRLGKRFLLHSADEKPIMKPPETALSPGQKLIPID